MVEDKWQARGQGRREVRTHQPTGGRGAQGGLKIGEMDRDAIIAHGGMSFVKESFMDRSDGTIIPICVGCGTIPIYNPKLNISICALCDGPIRFAGDNVNNLEILPPLGRPRSKIVEVAMPYSTKLLTQEQETYLNLTMRYITTSGLTKLNPLEFSGVSSEIVKELPRLILPETVVPAYIENVPKAVITVEQLRSMGATVNALSEEEKREIDIVLEPEELQFDQIPFEQMPQMQMQQMQMQPMQPQMQMQPMQPQMQMQQMQPQMQMQQMQPMQPQIPFEQMELEQMQQVPQMQQVQQVQQMPQVQPMQQMQQVQPMQQVPQMQPQMPQQGGLQMEGEGFISGQVIPGFGPLISVRTDKEAMMMDGLVQGGRQRRPQPRINPEGTEFKFIKLE